MLRLCRFALLICLAASGMPRAGLCAAEEPVSLPAQAPALIANGVNWPQTLADFQGADKDKQAAAAKLFLQTGERAFNELTPLTQNANPEIVKRASEIREQICQRSVQFFNEVLVRRQRIDSEPLAKPALEEINQAWIRCAQYAAQRQVKEQCFLQAREVQQLMKTLEQNTQELTAQDERLKTIPAGQKLQMAAAHLARAQALKTLQRDPETLLAAQQALDAAGAASRHAPAALKIMIETCQRKQDHARIAELSRTLIQNHPRSLEAKFAHQTLLEQFIAQSQWDSALAQLKTLLALFPVDEAVQEQAYSLLENLAEGCEYKHFAAGIDLLLEVFPLDRLSPEALKAAARCNEYALKNPSKAQRLYQMLQDDFADAFDPAELRVCLSRIKRKAAGIFPVEPLAADATPAGALARFLSAVRQHDQKALLAAVPKKEAASYTDFLNSSQMAGEAAFSDFILKDVKIDEKTHEAALMIEQYSSAAEDPAVLTQTAVQEDGQWKLLWKVKEEGGE